MIGSTQLSLASAIDSVDGDARSSSPGVVDLKQLAYLLASAPSIIGPFAVEVGSEEGVRSFFEAGSPG